MEECTEIKTWLTSAYNIRVSDDWLTACVEFIQQETNGSLDSFDQLRSLVFEQWLCSDLAEIGEPSLPAGIADAKKVDIVSSFPLQLVSVVDIGFPLFGQRQKLQRKDNPNVDVSADKPFQSAWEPKASRMLMMKLTDGHQAVEAIEYRQIRTLHPNLPAGTKLTITGPFVCRRNVLLLCEDNVRVLGGEVDALMEASTPLSNLEAMMEKNRLDEGKTESLKLSGRFISRGSNEKDDLKFKKMVKQEQNSSWCKTSNSQTTGKSFVSHAHYGANTKVEFKKEEIKTDGAQQTQKGDTDFQWEDDIDYDALFDDAMNSMDDMPSDPTHTRPPQVPTGTFNDLKQEHHQASHRGDTTARSRVSLSSSNDRRSAINPNSTVQLQFTACKVEEPYFDDDFEDFNLDDIEDSFPPRGFGAVESKSIVSAGKTMNDQLSDKVRDVKKLSPSFKTPFDRDSYQTDNSASSSPLSQLPRQTSDEQVSSPFSKSQFGSADQVSSSSSFSVRNSLTQQSSKRIATAASTIASNSFNSSSNKRPSPPAQQPKKRAKQSKIYEWGFGSSNKDLDRSLRTTTQSGKKGTFSETVQDTNTNKVSKPSNSSELPSSSSPYLDQPAFEPVNTSNAKDAVIISSGSATSSMEFSSPKAKILPKAVIHPFVDTDKDTGSKNKELLQKQPFQYLSNLSYDRGEAVFVKAYISTLTDKLGCAGGQAWTLSCRINDGTACIDVDLDNKVLTELIGFSAQDSIIMRQRMKSDPAVKEVLMGGLTQCQNKLINISCLMKIVISHPESKPLVTQFIPVTSDHVRLLQERVALLQRQ